MKIKFPLAVTGNTISLVGVYDAAPLLLFAPIAVTSGNLAQIKAGIELKPNSQYPMRTRYKFAGAAVLYFIVPRGNGNEAIDAADLADHYGAFGWQVANGGDLTFSFNAALIERIDAYIRDLPAARLYEHGLLLDFEAAQSGGIVREDLTALDARFFDLAGGNTLEYISLKGRV